MEHKALEDVSLEITDGSYTAVIGHTGSGKSTLMQHLNGLLKPTEGFLKSTDIRLRRKRKTRSSAI